MMQYLIYDIRYIIRPHVHPPAFLFQPSLLFSLDDFSFVLFSSFSSLLFSFRLLAMPKFLSLYPFLAFSFSFLFLCRTDNHRRRRYKPLCSTLLCSWHFHKKKEYKQMTKRQSSKLDEDLYRRAHMSSYRIIRRQMRTYLVTIS